MANPVSNPAWLVTNGNSKCVAHLPMLHALAATEVSANRGIGSVAEALTSVLMGAKLPPIVAVPRPGEFAPGLAVYEMYTGTVRLSTTPGLTWRTSYTASPTPVELIVTDS